MPAQPLFASSLHGELDDIVTTTCETAIVVSLGEMRVTNDSSAVLTCLGLGSCIGLFAYDPMARVGGTAHIVLPNSEGRTVGAPSKFADIAVPLLVQEMCSLGASERRLIITMAGGAQMSVAPGGATLFRIGDQNIDATKAALAKQALRVTSADVGGHHGRSVRLYVSSGKVTVKTAGAEPYDL